MNHKVLLGAAVLLLIAIVSTSARPEGTPDSVPSSTIANSGSTTAAPEESKVSKFFEDVSSAFKSGTAKVKESFESAASSVKDGVLRGYGFVKDKLTGSGDSATPSNNSTSSSTTAATVSALSSDESKVVSRSIDATVNAATTAKAKIEPNDEDAKDDDRLIFIGNEDTGTDSPTTIKPNKTNLDDRFIIDAPMACKIGQAEVSGKCRNKF